MFYISLFFISSAFVLYSFNLSKFLSRLSFSKSNFSGFDGLLKSVLFAAFDIKLPKPTNAPVVIIFSNVSRPKFAHSLLISY